MNIVVNHLTRMSPGYICVAGIDTSSNTHIRPVIPNTRLRTALLKRNGGLFDIASEIDLRQVTNIGRPPELEDRSFIPSKAQSVRENLPPDEFWAVLEASAQPTLRDIFGSDLENAGRSAALALNTGQGSLGCLTPYSTPYLNVTEYDGKEKLEIVLEDQYLGQLVVAVTDIRFHQSPGFKLRREIIDMFDNELRNGVPTILSVGVSRPFMKPGEVARRHWLQLNNIHLRSMPTLQDSSL